MQPLEMILGFNKDEGLHVIIDLLMDPTNDTNFRQVTLWNGYHNIKLLFFGARCEKVGQPMDPKCYLTSTRMKSPKMWLCLQTRWFSLFLDVVPFSNLDVVVGFVLAHMMIVFAAEFTSSAWLQSCPFPQVAEFYLGPGGSENYDFEHVQVDGNKKVKVVFWIK